MTPTIPDPCRRHATGRSRGTAAALSAVVGLMTLAPAALSAADQPVSYSREVRPILSNNCFACHGPDEQERAAGLQLDLRDPAIADLGGYAAIVPGDAEASELWQRITATDANEVMPPPKSNKPPLSEDEQDILRRWIEQGAVYEPHWAFQTVVKPQPPLVRNGTWVRNPIDRFILAELEKRGWQPSPEADRRTLIRRVYLDLLGLTPPPEEVERFVNDPADDAYETLVDRLLDSPHYGERWGRHWLDQARYADSNGYSIDSARTMWPYRDWVIRALNEDMPFDRFTIEQVAGDLLPDATTGQRLASAFNRNTLINEEGGSDPEQFRSEIAVDRVNTTGAVWLGLTLACAECHTHKYDPVTHEDYFRLFAFFNQATDRNNRGEQIDLTFDDLPLGHPRHNGADAGLAAELRDQVQQLEAGLDQRREQWLREVAALGDAGQNHEQGWQAFDYLSHVTENNVALQALDDGSLLVDRQAKGNDNYLLRGRFPTATEVIRLTVLPHESLPSNGPGTAGNGNFVLTGFEIWIDDQQVPVRYARASHAQPDYPVQATIDGSDANGWAINVGNNSDRRMNTAHRAEFILESPVPAGAGIEIRLRHQRNPDYLVGRFRIDGAAQAPALPPLDDTVAADLVHAARTAEGARDDRQRRLLDQAFGFADGEAATLRDRLARAGGGAGLDPIPVMVMQDLPPDRWRETYIHLRGDFLSPDKDTGPLQPGVPAVLPQIETANGRPANRLDLARWLVDTDNPLTARVTVNRVWMRYFGLGLVETEEDFGMQGSLPSHPELLDWLAAAFMESGWSKKRLHRAIVTSATYRQASHARPDLDSDDPRNRLLARQNRIRVDAEIIRDLKLSASGRLAPVLGGPPVFPPQPDGVYAFTQRGKPWNTSQGDDRHRRTLYTHFYRSAPYPLLTTFDAPDFGTSCTRRMPSNTPLQALALANDEGLFELAQAMGARLLSEVPGAAPQPATDRRRIAHGFVLAVGREPAAAELDHLLRWLDRARDDLAGGNGRAADIAGPAALGAAAGDPVEAAAWVGLARVLFNTDEFITRE